MLVGAAIISRMHYDAPVKGTEAMVEEQKFYALTTQDGKDVLHVIVYAGKDTIVAGTADSLVLRTITRFRPASWVNRFWLPSCLGYVAANTDDKAEKQSEMAPLDDKAIPALLKLKGEQMTKLKQNYAEQLDEINYYLNSHSMQDEGFDIVVRRREAVVALQDSVQKLMKLVADAAKCKGLKVEPRERYEVVADSFRVKAKAISCSRDGYRMYKTAGGKMPKKARPVYINVDNIGNGAKTAKALPEYQDTLYVGSRDRKGRLTGVAKIIARDGSYYEGQVTDTLYEGAKAYTTLRHGAGVMFSTQFVRAGLWKNDRYQGEQPVYTANHVYGIDISRYQHEPSGGKTVTKVKKVKVGKRWKKVKVKEKVVYPIDWKNLRITSLGTLSKKKINGTVDYPISFIYIKSTEGASVLNKYFLSDYTQARKHGYKVGAYHFYSTKTYAASQAMYFIKNSRYEKGDLPPVLDVEPSHQQIMAMGGPEAMLGSIRKWLELVEKYRGVRPILYVSQNFINKYFIKDYKNGEYLRKNYHVWIARYGEYKPDVHLDFWQLCPDGHVKGIYGYTDINIFNGYADTFKAY